jgi:NAD-dependent deacetylase
MKKLVFLTGAGMSAESGISTFRDANGLWEGHDVLQVATPQAWDRDPELVLEFYNQRRKQLFEVDPNPGHEIIAELQREFDVHIVTQNVDDLHERAGNSNIVHLHGELKKARSTGNPEHIQLLDQWELKWGDICPEGYQLRPHIVWFGEAVPKMDEAQKIVSEADHLVVVGTSLVVYPAASLIHFINQPCEVTIIDPVIPEHVRELPFNFIEEGASSGLKKLKDKL